MDFRASLPSDRFRNRADAAARSAQRTTALDGRYAVAVEGADDWGIADVKNKNKANLVVDSIESRAERKRRQRKEAGGERVFVLV